jgi:hypothetical protein
VSVRDELKDFIAAHREHDQLAGDATEPGLAGFQIWIACPCGVTFRRQVTEGTRASTSRSWPGWTGGTVPSFKPRDPLS